MKHQYIVLVVLLSLFSTAPLASAEDLAVDSGYQHLIEKNTLRCGYSPWPDLIDVDPTTKKLSGVFYDYMNELGRIMDIKIEWVEEVPFGEIPQALNSGRIDAHCSGAWTNPIRSKFADSVTPIAYQYITAFVRGDDNRFDGHMEKANAPDIKIATIDGESSATIAAASFPNAKIISSPQGTDGTQMLLDVISKKADVAFTDLSMLHRVEHNNSGKTKQVRLDYPLQVFGTPIWVRKGAVKLKNSLDVATQQLINDGSIAKILAKHEKIKGAFLRPHTAYQPQ